MTHGQGEGTVCRPGQELLHALASNMNGRQLDGSACTREGASTCQHGGIALQSHESKARSLPRVLAMALRPQLDVYVNLCRLLTASGAYKGLALLRVSGVAHLMPH